MIFLSIAIILLSIDILSIKGANAQYSDLPPPPQKPDRFTSKQQLKDYLVKLHEYYAIIGRPRFGRRSSPSIPNDNGKNFKEEQMIETMVEQNLNRNHLHPTRDESNKPIGSSSENLLLKILRSNYFDDEETKVKNSLSTSKLLDLIDENNDGETTDDEFKNFMSFFYTDFSNLNNNNNNQIKDFE
jgi:hypothetical protein